MKIAGRQVTIDRSFFLDDKPKPRAFLTRVLTNLKQLYFNKQRHDEALLMIEYQVRAPARRFGSPPTQPPFRIPPAPLPSLSGGRAPKSHCAKMDFVPCVGRH